MVMRDWLLWQKLSTIQGNYTRKLYKEITFRSFATLHKATQIFSFVFTRVVGWGRWGQMCIHDTSYRKFLRQSWRIRDLKEGTGSTGSNQVSTMQTSFKPQVHNQVCQLSTIKCANYQLSSVPTSEQNSRNLQSTGVQLAMNERGSRIREMQIAGRSISLKTNTQT